MAGFFKAILGDLAFLLDNMKMIAPSMEDKRLNNLERLLLRVHMIMEEAEGRHITNKAMVYQLDLLRKEMYRGRFIVDNLKIKRTEARGHGVSNSSFVLSIFNPAKRLFLSNVDRGLEIDLQQVIDKLNNIMEGVNNETIMFLRNYPRLYRQPYSVHLSIDNCMFGRQMEMERIMEFLIEKEEGTRNVGVLPIVGPVLVGKSTLVAHVCDDARVRDYFSQIMIIKVDGINNENISTLTDRGVIMHKNDAFVENQRLLAIIELSGDVDGAAWNSLLSSPCYIGRANKIIITSRSNKIVTFGTTQALMLNFLPPEAFWYFFKNTLFGSIDSSNHPGLESVAMEIARGLNGSFRGANVTFGFLRYKLVAKYWWSYLASFRKNMQRNILFDERLGLKTETYLRRGEVVVWGSFRACSIEENVPHITMEDVMHGYARYQAEFNVLAWKSHIRPYNFYTISCKIEKSE